MNKYQAAWDFINTVTGVTDRNRIMPLKELVDKETPMKPIFDDYEKELVCPKCISMGIKNYEYHTEFKRCIYCCQVIDWSG